MKDKYNHKPPQRLYMKIFVGYFLLVGLVLAAAALMYAEYRSIMDAVRAEEETTERWQQANRTFEAMFDLAMSEQHLLASGTGGYGEYERKSLAAQKMLDGLKPLYPEAAQRERIDSAKAILAEKNAQVLEMAGVFEDLSSTDSLIECQIREITQTEQAAVRNIHAKGKEKKKGTWLGRLFKKKKETDTGTEQRATTASHSRLVTRLTGLRRNMRERNDMLRRRMENHADSLRQRNRLLNESFSRLMHEFQQAASGQREETMDKILETRKKSFAHIGTLAVSGILLSILFFTFIHRDIRRRYRERLRLMALNKEKNELLEQKQRMIQNVSHELRSPLATVMGYAELLPDGERTGETKGHILSASRRMQGLLNTLLHYCSLSSGKERADAVLFSPKGIADTLEGLFVLRAGEKGLSFHAEYEGGDVVVSGDRERILQIGQNLLSNAVKFTDEGGVALLVRYGDGILTLEVSDTGTGMTREEAGRVFLPFERLANADVQDGFGLGLSIVRGLAEMLGGSVGVDSREGEGSVFTVSLPVPVADPEKVAEEREKAETGLPYGLCILAIDDDGVLLNVIERQLELAGAHCDTCRTPGGMIGLLRKRRYDLLLTDIRMPEMNGYRLLELLRNSNVGNSRELPVLAVTAHVAKKESDFVKAGFAGCLYKPFSAEELYAAIRTVLARHGEDGYKEEKTELDFSPLLVKEENGRAMLGILAGQTRKDMEALEEAVRRRDRPALADITHHLLPVWTLLRAEKSLHRLRSSYRQEPPDWDGIAAAARDVADMGKRIAKQVERKEAAYGE